MPVKILLAQNLVTNRWSGGTTTELFIYPPTAVYAQRNFDFRLSTATVEAEESEFTSLPGYARKLMVLAGQTTLHHENHHRITLQKFDVDTFNGSWKTTSVGKCTDFNVMTRGRFSANMKALSIPNNCQEEIILQQNCKWFFLYQLTGKTTVFADDLRFLMNAGDFGIIENPNQSVIKISAEENSEVVLVEVSEKLRGR
jgi:environmental stress-induced protein Ves